MHKIFAIAAREVRGYLQDRVDLAFSLLLPVAIFALMYGAFSGQTLFNGTAFIVNEDTYGQHALRLVERLAAREGLEVQVITLADANARLERSDILVAAVIPEGFSRSLDSGWSTHITFRQRGHGGAEGQIVAGMIRAEADALSQELQLERQVQLALAGRGIAGDQVRTTFQELLKREKQLPTVQVVTSAVGGAGDPVHVFLPGILSMFVLFAITLNSRALVMERLSGTLERLLTTQLSVTQLYLGKLVASMARGSVQVLTLLALGGLVFNLFTPSSFVAMLAVSVLFVTTASALALIIASISRTEHQAISISVLITMATVMLGGTFFPIPSDSVLELLSRASINTYANSAFRALLSGNVSQAELTLDLLVLGVSTVVALAFSRALFRVVSEGSR